VATGIPQDKVKAFPIFGLGYALRLSSARNLGELLAAYVWGGQKFCRAVVQTGLGDADAVYTFNTAGLEILAAAKARGLKTISEQTIAPFRVERQLLEDEESRFPSWGNSCLRHNEHLLKYIRREEEEWQLADLILCGSRFVVDGIERSGGPVHKCRVVP